MKQLIAVLLMFAAFPFADAQDRVTVLMSDNKKTIVREGTVIDWIGSEMQMEFGGRINTIKNEKIVNVETNWPADYLIAREAISNNQHTAAIPSLQNAVATESRPWVKRLMLAQLTRLLVFASDSKGACEAFLLLLQDDPETRDFPAIPLCWTGETTDKATFELARKMVEAKSVHVQLLGASWLLSSPDRATALKKLEALSRDLDSRIAHLASAQLWRAKVVEVDATTLGRWERQVERMPKALRSGPLFVLAQGQERLGKTNEAILSWLKVPILHEADYYVAACALRHAALALQDSDKKKEAERVWNELATSFPSSSFFNEAHAAIEKLRQLNDQQKGP